MVFQVNQKEVIPFMISAAIGVVGAFGQAAILHNSLVHSYPFKMMDMPPAEFYSSVGNLGYYCSVVLALISVGISKRLHKYFVAAIPVAVCPLIYWLVFEIAHLTSTYQGDLMLGRNFEGYTGQTARYEFGFEVLGLLFWGTTIGFVLGFIIERISKAFTDKLA